MFKTVRKRLLRLFLFIFIGLMIPGGKAQAAGEEKRVLFISSYSYAWEQTRLQIEGIRAGLGQDVVLDYEFMDTKRVNTKEAAYLFYDMLAYRLSMVEPYDAVILGDDAALIFAMAFQDEVFPGIPMVFEGVNDEDLMAEAVANPMITGVAERLSVEKNVEFGLKLNPDAKRVVAILDDTLTGEAERKRYYSCAEKFPDLEFDEINVSQSSTFEVRYALSSLKEDTILLYIVMTEDAEGRKYTDRQAVNMILECAPVPTLRMVEAGIGTGLLGGHVVSMRKSGEIAAQMAMEIMQGQDIGSYGLVTDDTQAYCVDALVMERFDLSMSLLPEGTEVVNGKGSFFQRNREAIIPLGILLLVVIGIAGWALVDNLKRRHLVEVLEDSKKTIESASQHDFLTGLPNRSKFMSDIGQLLEEKMPCTVIMIDIDDFKTINDTMGHTAGDEALRQVASRLQDMDSEILTSYRFAGDEFILILKSSLPNLIEKTAYQCRQVFTSPFVLDGKKVKVYGSIGIASYPKDSEDVELLIICADDAMYQVKKSGKNDFAYYGDQEL